jgi:hypothetical protein
MVAERGQEMDVIHASDSTPAEVLNGSAALAGSEYLNHAGLDSGSKGVLELPGD